MMKALRIVWRTTLTEVKNILRRNGANSNNRRLLVTFIYGITSKLIIKRYKTPG